jgi:hypothetical protein
VWGTSWIVVRGGNPCCYQDGIERATRTGAYIRGERDPGESLWLIAADKIRLRGLLVYGEWQEDRDCGEEDRLWNAGRPERDGRKSGGIGDLLQIPGHREVRSAVEEGQQQRLKAVKWRLFISHVPLIIPSWNAHLSQYSLFASDVFLTVGEPLEMTYRA